MKHLKIFEDFDEKDGDYLEEILLPIKHYGFIIEEVKNANATRVIDNVIQHGDIYRSFNIFFKPSIENRRLDDEFFEELDYAIKHIESLYKVKLTHLFSFYRTLNYSKTVADFKEYYKDNKNFSMFEIQFEDSGSKSHPVGNL